jgi:hypothetical protein
VKPNHLADEVHPRSVREKGDVTGYLKRLRDIVWNVHFASWKFEFTLSGMMLGVCHPRTSRDGILALEQFLLLGVAKRARARR